MEIYFAACYGFTLVCSVFFTMCEWRHFCRRGELWMGLWMFCLLIIGFASYLLEAV